MHYRGSLFRQVPGNDLLFDIDLSNEARFDLADFIRQEKLDGDSRLTRSSLREVRCRFENSTVPRIRRGEEAINQFHPLVRFVSSRLEASDERRRPAVAVRLRASQLLGKVGPGVYGFSAQRWSVRGLRHAEKLSYAALPVDPAGDPLRSGDAELLIGTASSEGTAWLSAGGAVDTRILAEQVEQGCVEPSERAFGAYVEELEAENEDRADMLLRMVERRFGTQSQQLKEQLRIYETAGPARLVPPTKGRLRALKARADHRRRKIEEDRDLKWRKDCWSSSPAEAADCRSCEAPSERQSLRFAALPGTSATSATWTTPPVMADRNRRRPTILRKSEAPHRP